MSLRAPPGCRRVSRRRAPPRRQLLEQCLALAAVVRGAGGCQPYYRIDNEFCSETCLGSRLGLCPRRIIVSNGGLTEGTCPEVVDTRFDVPAPPSQQKAGPCGSLDFTTWTEPSPSRSPTLSPTPQTALPSQAPTSLPTLTPSMAPSSAAPTAAPTATPTAAPLALMGTSTTPLPASEAQAPSGKATTSWGRRHRLLVPATLVFALLPAVAPACSHI
mmetsp:Transcript_43616/g.120690  ORF Transcript_43616/g.120690 Transcript_43616/m.120690 type:complete len:217 (-) Transcript_43616:143-793(-)